MNQSRAEFNKPSVFGVCEQMGEAAVLADLERAGVRFTSTEQKWQAWEWVYLQRLKREETTDKAVRDTARQTLWVAVGTAVVALFTAIMALTALFRSP